MQKAFPLIYGQCTEFLRAKQEGLENWKITSNTFDVIAIIRAIKGLSYIVDGQEYRYHAVHTLTRKFYTFCQGAEMTNATYLEVFNTNVEVLEKYEE